MNPTRLHLAAAFTCIASVATCATGSAGCGEEECELDSVTRKLGGAGLIDCGLAIGDPSNVDRCAVSANRAGSTFRALYEREDGGVDVIMRVAGGGYVALQLVAEDGRIEARQLCGGPHLYQFRPQLRGSVSIAASSASSANSPRRVIRGSPP